MTSDNDLRQAAHLREITRLKMVESAASALIADVRRRYPREDLRCEYMRALDASLTQEKTDV
jgi:hypothetical protein